MKILDRITRLLGMPVRIPGGRTSGNDLRVSIDGGNFQVHSERTELELSPEALGSAFLLPAASAGRRLAGDSIDATWLKGSSAILDLARDWWGWRADIPRFSPTHAVPSAKGVGLAFSLGVDSFYSLFFADPRPDLLILAAGFDVPLEKRAIIAALSKSVGEVAEATGRDWTVIETDLRRHKLFRKTKWDFSHGGALAFLGHLLQERIGTLLISSSTDQDHLAPWGTHPDLDSLWSSDSLKVKHVGHQTYRSEKLRQLVNHPVARNLIQQHLRVCYENPSRNGNCGCCHKCVLTRINLHRDAPDFHLETMPEDIPLVQAIEALPPMTNPLAINLRKELVGSSDLRVDAALRDLIRRSEEGLSR